MNRSEQIQLEQQDPDRAEMERIAAERARSGDLYAIEVWRRLRLGRERIMLDLPPIDDLAGVMAAHAVVIKEMAAGQIGSRDALAVTSALDQHRRMLVSVEYQQRIWALDDTEDEEERALLAASSPRTGP